MRRWPAVAAVVLVAVAAGLGGLAGGMALRGGGAREATPPPAAPAGGGAQGAAPPLERPTQPLVGVWPGLQVDDATRQGVSEGLLALLNAYVQSLRAADPSPLDGAARGAARDSLAQVVRELGGTGFVVEELTVTPVIVDVKGDAVTVQLELYVKGAPARPGEEPGPSVQRQEGVFRWLVGFARDGDRYVAQTLAGAPEMPWRQPPPSGGGR